MSKRARTVIAGLVMTALVVGEACAAAGHEEVAVYVDRERVDFVSKIRGGRLPALMVEGHAMVSARFMAEALGHGLDLHMWNWGIVRIGHLSFKMGCDYVIKPVPKIGGTLGWQRELPLAPRTISGRLYVPAVATLKYLGHKAEWDAGAKALRITSREKLESQQE